MNLLVNKQGLIDYLKVNGKQDLSWNKLAEMFNLQDGECARKTWSRFKNNQNNQNNYNKTEENMQQNTKIVELSEDLKSGNAEMRISTTEEIKCLEDLEKIIDTEKWDIVKYIQNYWSGKYQVKAWLEPKKSKESEIIKNILSNYKTSWTEIEKSFLKINTKWSNDSLLVINLNDLHFDKLDLTNNTIDKRIEDYKECLKNLLLRSYHSSKIDEIIFVVGNDMFNTDNIHGTTTNGTPQQINENWEIAYEKVFNVMVESIAFLKSYCSKLNVLLVQGNHDRTKSYYLAHALQVYFNNDKSITFDRSSNLKKRFIYGNTFLGFNHGNNINDKLPLAFATEFYEDWGKCKYHDLLISDKHHNNEKIFKSNQTQNEFQGVKLRILPSLTGADRWHNDNLYHSRQSGIALVYDKERGKFAEFEYQL